MAGVLALQRSIGNQAICRLVAGDVLQAKLQVGPAGDRYEREADRVAGEVMRDLAPSVTPDDEFSRVRRSVVDEVVGLEGGPLATDTEARIQRSRGRGSPLPESLRRSMENSFGAHFGTVRVHTDPSADELNRSLRSRAFTVGGDIFFAQNQYQPRVKAGQELLAHELTHTIQQGGAPVRRSSVEPAVDARRQAGTRVQRKLTWKGTNWSKARYLDASSGGGGGVLFVGENTLKEVVVKPGEAGAAEAALAAALHNKVGKAKSRLPWKKGGARGDDLVVAPGLRLVTADEGRKIQAALTPHLNQAGSRATPDQDPAFLQTRAKTLLTRLQDPGTQVQDFGVGVELKDALAAMKKHTETKDTPEGGTVEFHPQSPMRIFTDQRSIHALGMNTAVDLLFGNMDRLFQFNTENFLVTPYSITVIDNIWGGTEAGYLQTTQVAGHGDKTFTVTAKEATEVWRRNSKVVSLAQNDFDGLADVAWKNFTGELPDRLKVGYLKKGASPEERKTRKQEREELDAVLAANEEKFKRHFSAGLAEGKKRLLSSLSGLLNNRKKLAKLVPGANVDQILKTLEERRKFLKSGSA